MSRGNEEDMRTALRQASAIASFESQPSVRRTLLLAHHLYDAMLRLTPEARRSRSELIDAIFRCPSTQVRSSG
jgi:hypothetical protein